MNRISGAFDLRGRACRSCPLNGASVLAVEQCSSHDDDHNDDDANPEPFRLLLLYFFGGLKHKHLRVSARGSPAAHRPSNPLEKDTLPRKQAFRLCRQLALPFCRQIRPRHSTETRRSPLWACSLERQFPICRLCASWTSRASGKGQFARQLLFPESDLRQNVLCTGRNCVLPMQKDGIRESRSLLPGFLHNVGDLLCCLVR